MRVYKPAEFAELAGVSVSTLQRWDRDGILVANRTMTNRREYTDAHLSQVHVNRLGKAAQSSGQSDVSDKRKPGRPGVDLTGRDFGELHVLRRDADYVYASGRRDAMWLCRCSCGNLTSVRTANLVSGGTVSCGCMRAGRRFLTEFSASTQSRHVSSKVLARTEAMVHQYYGRWFVESVAYETCQESDTKIRLNCVCRCGTHRKVLRSSLMAGSSVSCGCYRRDVLAEKAHAEDLVDQRFGRWRVESRGETRVYPGGGQVIMWNCVCECGTRRAVSRLALKSGESQSCGCAGEPGMRAEMVTVSCLDAMELNYVRQKKYPGLVGVKGKSLSYDFEVSFYDKTFLVECQGEQHFRPVAFFGGEDVYQVQQEHDRRKRDYCTLHDIPLLEIPYTVRTYDDVYLLISSFLNILKSA